MPPALPPGLPLGRHRARWKKTARHPGRDRRRRPRPCSRGEAAAGPKLFGWSLASGLRWQMVARRRAESQPALRHSGDGDGEGRRRGRDSPRGGRPACWRGGRCGRGEAFRARRWASPRSAMQLALPTALPPGLPARRRWGGAELAGKSPHATRAETAAARARARVAMRRPDPVCLDGPLGCVGQWRRASGRSAANTPGRVC